MKYYVTRNVVLTYAVEADSKCAANSQAYREELRLLKDKSTVLDTWECFSVKIDRVVAVIDKYEYTVDCPEEVWRKGRLLTVDQAAGDANESR